MTDLMATAAAHVDFLPLGERAALLTRWADRLRHHHEAMARTITTATGKPIRLARVEVDRALITLRATAGEANRLRPRFRELGEDGMAEIHRVPVGPVLAVTPFNFPLNLAMHKIAPALLAGCPVIWKPSPKAPGVAEAALGHLLAAGAEPGFVQLAAVPDAAVERLAADPRLGVLSVTASTAVGRRLQSLATRARTVLELGGNAAVILDHVENPAAAAAKIAFGACAHAGQVCISIQRILVPAAELPAWRERLVAAFDGLPTGDPWDDTVLCGPLIDAAARARVADELAAITARGGRAIAGGTWMEGHGGRILRPTLIEGLPASDPAVRDREQFAPIAFLIPYQSLDHALELAEDTPFGLNAGIFTRDDTVVAKAFARLAVGTLVVNDIPSRRDDRLPYGGLKDSGGGREGSDVAVDAYAIERVLWRAG